jgi:hypothetical protein
MVKNIVLDKKFDKEVQTDILKTLREYLLKHKLLHNVKIKHINSLKEEGMYIDDMWWYIGKNDREVLGVINKVVMKYFVKYLHQHKCYKEYYQCCYRQYKSYKGAYELFSPICPYNNYYDYSWGNIVDRWVCFMTEWVTIINYENFYRYIKYGKKNKL